MCSTNKYSDMPFSEAILDSMPGGVMTISLPTFRVVSYNAKLRLLLGYSRDESPSESGLLSCSNDIGTMRTIIAQAAEKGQSRGRCRMLKRDGTSVSGAVYCLKMAVTGEENHVLCQFFEDEAEFVFGGPDQQIDIRALVDSMPVGMARMRIGDDGVRVEYANTLFYRQMGYAPDVFAAEPVTGRYDVLIHVEDRNRVVQKIRELLSSGKRPFPVLEFRIISGTDGIRWVHAGLVPVCGMDDFVLCLLRDSTDERRTKLQTMLNERRYRFLFEQTQEIVFDWDVQKHLIHHSPVISSKLGYPVPHDFSVEMLFETNIIHADDKPVIREMVDELTSGRRSNLEREYRIRKADGSYFWCRNNMSVILDENRNPVWAVGILSDIDAYKKALLRESEWKDPLTGLANRSGFLEQSGERLEVDASSRHMILMLDVDGFEEVNRSQGNDAGDNILKNIAVLMHSQFRQSDLMGRVDRDAFCVFMSGVPSKDIIWRKAEQLLDACRTLRAGDMPVTVSIGIALYPDHGHNAQELYRRAERALWRSKRNGKDCFSLYSSSD